MKMYFVESMKQFEHVPKLVEIHSGYPILTFWETLKTRSNHYEFKEIKSQNV